MDTKKDKILFVVSTLQHYCNFIKTGALKEIQDRVIFLIHPKLAKMDFGVPSDRIFFYSYSGKKDIFHRHVFNINSYLNRHKSSVFAFRLLRLKPRQLRIYRILAFPVLGSIVKSIFLKRAEDKSLFKLVQKINPALIIVPSHAFEGMTFELIKIAKKIKAQSFLLAEQWDTLPCKTVFTFKPDYVGVWSQQGVEHAVNIRDMAPERVFILGVPRFTDYLKPEARHLPSPYPFKYILYAGVSIQYNELAALHKIDELIEKLGLDLKVVFRPAKAQRIQVCPDVFFEYDFKHVILDTPTRSYYKKGVGGDVIKDGFSSVFAFDQNHIARLLANMEFMVSPFTTMVLEASLFDKKVFTLVYDDGFHASFSLKYLFKTLLHSKGIDGLKNMRMVHSFDDLEKIFSEGDQLKQSDVKLLDIDYFVSKEATANYPANLRKVVETILENREPSL